MAVNVFDLLIELLDKDVIVFCDNSRLKIKDKNNSLDQSQLDSLKNEKLQILQVFRENCIVSSARIALLSAQQKSIWLSERMSAPGYEFNVPGSLHLVGELNADILSQAIVEVVNRHDVLRTVYFEVSGSPYQAVQAKVDPEFINIVDLSSLENCELNEGLEKEKISEAKKPFNIQRDLPFRAKLLKVSAFDHTLLLTMHHICSDAWSVDIFFKEISSLYTSKILNQPHKLADLPIQYLDYADWQNKKFRRDGLASGIGYWKRRLNGVPSVHGLITDKPRPSSKDLTAGHFWSELDVELAKSIQIFCKQHELTQFIFLQTAFSCLLHIYSNQSDIVMGSPVANRHRSELSTLIGFFVNTLVLRTNVCAEEGFLDLIKRNKSNILDDFDHQELPFDLLVSELLNERNEVIHPLFQIMFAYQSHKRVDLVLPGLEVCRPEQGYTAAKFDLGLEVIEDESGFKLHWEWSQSLFNAESVEAFSASFLCLLDSILENPNKRINRLNAVTNLTRDLQMSNWNASGSIYPNSSSVHTLFESKVLSHPNKIAIVSESKCLTYGQLNQRANRLANFLLEERGVNSETLVGLCFDRSVEAVIAMLGILKAGAAYVPLEPNYPKQRKEIILNDGSLGTVITRRSLRQRIPSPDSRILCIDDEAIQEAISKRSCFDTAAEAFSANSVAYVIYTSGTTGKPKGCEVLHRGITSLVCNNNFVALGNSTVMLHNAPIGFDAATFEIWGSLLNGGSLVIQPDSHIAMDTLGEFLNQHKVNTAWMTSGLFDQFAAHYQYPLSTLRFLIVGGDIVSKSAVNRIREHNSDLTVINGYGPTENTTFSTCYTIPASLENTKNIAIGKPLANRSIYILNDAKSLLPIGAIGEIYLAGDGLARGYFNEPTLSADKFVANPFYDKNCPYSSERMYKTGDLARWLNEGLVEFIGRRDQQVKIRGFRIELAEIENVLAEHEGVKEVVVLLKTDRASNNKRLLAYVVTGNKIPMESDNFGETLRTHCRHYLPDYMEPSVFTFLSSIPLTLNGKIDKSALLNIKNESAHSTFIPPETDREKLLCSIWQDVLGLEKVSVSDNFFHLGGDSLVVMTVVVKMREQGFSVQPRDVLTAKTIRRLCSLLEQNSTQKNCEVGISYSGNLVLTPWQKAMFLKHTAHRINYHNMHHRFELKSPSNIQALKSSLRLIIKKHDALRTIFSAQGDVISAKVSHPLAESDESGVYVNDLSTIDSAQKDEHILAHFHRDRKRYIDVFAGKIIRLDIWRFGSGEADTLILTVSHTVCDVYSLNIIYEDLITAYNQILANQEPRLPEISTAIQIATEKITEFSNSHQLKSELEYWRSVPLSSISKLHHDYIDIDEASISSGQSYLWKRFSKNDTEKLLALLSSFDNTSIADLLTFLAVEAQSYWLGGTYFRVNVLNNGRNILEGEYYVDLSRSVGYYNLTKLLFLKSTYREDARLAFLHMVDQINSIPTKGVGIRYLLNNDSDPEIVDCLSPLKSYLKTPSVFLIQYFGVVDDASAIGIGLDDEKNVSNIYRISLESQIKSGCLEIRWSYNKNVYDSKTVVELVKYSDRLLHDLIINSDVLGKEDVKKSLEPA